MGRWSHSSSIPSIVIACVRLNPTPPQEMAKGKEEEGGGGRRREEEGGGGGAYVVVCHCPASGKHKGITPPMGDVQFALSLGIL